MYLVKWEGYDSSECTWEGVEVRAARLGDDGLSLSPHHFWQAFLDRSMVDEFEREEKARKR
jgi:hypothetical protein